MIYFKLKTEQNKKQNGQCYSDDHNAEDYIHTVRNHNRRTALERAVTDYWGWGGRLNMFY